MKMGRFKELSMDKNYLVGIVCLTILYTVVALVLLLKVNFYKNELEKAVELRKVDLQNVDYWIKENKDLKRQYEELEEKYNYAIEVIRKSDKYNMPEELE